MCEVEVDRSAEGFWDEAVRKLLLVHMLVLFLLLVLEIRPGLGKWGAAAGIVATSDDGTCEVRREK